MKARFVVVIGALVVSAESSAAQSPQCVDNSTGSGPVKTNVCNAALDLFRYMAPQLGAVITGGNTTLAQGGSLGGPSHFAISLRANALRGSLPQIDKYTPSLTTRRPETIDTREQVLLLPSVDAAVGVFAGLPLGVTKVGGLDLLLNASYIPEFNGGGVSVKLPEGSLKLGFGARLGLLEESLTVPGVGVSYMWRDLPTTNISAQNGANKFNVKDLSVKTTSWRVTASKSLVFFGLAAGVGQDTYKSSAEISGAIATVSTNTFRAEQKLTRTNYFADLSMNLMMAKLVAEIGAVTGGDVTTYNTLAGKAADAQRLYGSLGLRIGF